MKKIVASALMVVAFAAGAQAQEQKKPTYNDIAAVQITRLDEKLHLEPNLKNDLNNLLILKQEKLAAAKTEAEKQEIYRTVERKILVSLTPDQQKLLTADPDLLKKLTR